MSSGELLTTNPLLFGHARGVDEVELSSAATEIAQYFLEPRPADEGIADGIEPSDLEMARKTGLVVPVDSSGYQAARLWEDRGWSRAAFLMQGELDLVRADPGQLAQADAWRPSALGQVALPVVDVAAPVSLDALVRRRTKRSFADRPMDVKVLSEILRRLGPTPSWLHVLLAVQDVEGVDRGVYCHEPSDHRLDLVRAAYDDTELLAAVNHQPWVSGSGACAFLVVQWERVYAGQRRSRAYVDVLIEVGEVAQTLLHAVYNAGAGAWGTPALHETASRRLIGVDQAGIDALYAVKFGPVEGQ